MMGKNEIDILLELLSQLSEKMDDLKEDVSEIKLNCARQTTCKAAADCRLVALETDLATIKDDRKTIKIIWDTCRRFWWLLGAIGAGAFWMICAIVKHWDKIVEVIKATN